MIQRWESKSVLFYDLFYLITHFLILLLFDILLLS